MSIRNVELHIEKLVLKGFEARGRHQIVQAIEQELIQLFTKYDVLTSLLQSRGISYLMVAHLKLLRMRRPK